MLNYYILPILKTILYHSWYHLKWDFERDIQSQKAFKNEGINKTRPFSKITLKNCNKDGEWIFLNILTETLQTHLVREKVLNAMYCMWTKKNPMYSTGGGSQWIYSERKTIDNNWTGEWEGTKHRENKWAK